MEITKNLFVVVCVLLVCLMPVVIVNSLEVGPRYTVYGLVFSLVNSSVNPLIYAWRHPHFKVVLRLMVKCRYREIPRPSDTLLRLL